MTEFVFGRGAGEKTEYILGKMEQSLKVGKRVIIIVPEHQAMVWDTLTAERLSPIHAFNTETVSFTRLADNVFRAFGGTARKYITDSQKLLLMWNTLVACADKTEAFHALDREDRYTSLFLQTVNELKLYSLSPGDVVKAAEEFTPDTPLGKKLSDLALIYAAYDEMLHASFSDPLEIPDMLCETLRHHEYFSDCAVFIDSFYTLTPKEIEIFREIVQSCDDVTVTFPVSREDKDGLDSSFVFDYAKKLSSICSRCAREVKVTELPCKKAEEFLYLSENLWNYSATPYEKDTDRITLIRCNDRYDEATLAAAQIKRLVANGASYSQIAVVASSIEPLRGITDTELEKMGIPVYVSGKTPLSAQSVFKFICAALEVIGGGWKRESLCSFLKTGLCGLSPDVCDSFDKYTSIWNINGKRLYTGDPWTMNPDGYTESLSARGEELLTLANAAKERIVPGLCAFEEAFGEDITQVCRAVYKLLCDFDIYSRLRHRYLNPKAEDTLADTQKTAQVWDSLMGLLDTLATTVPDGKTDPIRFEALLKKAAEGVCIGTIPDGIDRVVLGDAATMRLDGISHLIVLGAVSGEFPALPNSNSYFSDRDRELLENAGLKLSPPSDARLREELFRFKYTLSSPESSLTVMIPENDGEASPSSGATALMRIFPKAQILDYTGQRGGQKVEKFGGMGLENSNISLCADSDRLSPTTAEEAFGSVLSMTQSKLEAFNDCPFKYFAQYVLRLDNDEKAEFAPSDVGNFVHGVIENFMREAADENVFPIPEETIISRSDRLVRDYVARVCPDTVSSRRDWLFRRIHRNIELWGRSLSEEFAQSRFRPYKFELPVGFDDTYLPIKKIPLSNGTYMSLRGKIDRVDILREGSNAYLRVADYKTNSKSFSKKDVTEGRNVQLMLYLFSLCDSPDNCRFHREAAQNGEKLIPAGAVYFAAVPGGAKASSPVFGNEGEKVALKSITRKGIVLRDLSVIQAMDRDISGVYAPATLNKDGSYSKHSSTETLEGFGEIEKAMNRSLAAVGDRIMGGEAGSCPQMRGGQSPCTLCSMKPLCRHESRKEENEDEL